MSTSERFSAMGQSWETLSHKGEALVEKCLEDLTWKELVMFQDSELIDALRTAGPSLSTPPPEMPNQSLETTPDGASQF